MLPWFNLFIVSYSIVFFIDLICSYTNTRMKLRLLLEIYLPATSDWDAFTIPISLIFLHTLSTFMPVEIQSSPVQQTLWFRRYVPIQSAFEYPTRKAFVSILMSVVNEETPTCMTNWKSRFIFINSLIQ